VRESVKYGMGLDRIRKAPALAALLCAAVALSLLAASCGTAADARRDKKLQQHKRFLTKTYAEQHRDFYVFPVERQFDIYLVGMLMLEPPDWEFGEDLVKSKKERAVPFLIEKLKQKDFPDYGRDQGMTDTIKELTIYLFRQLEYDHYYDVAHDDAALAAIRGAIAEMQTPASKRRSQGYLDEILGKHQGQ